MTRSRVIVQVEYSVEAGAEVRRWSSHVSYEDDLQSAQRVHPARRGLGCSAVQLEVSWDYAATIQHADLHRKSRRWSDRPGCCRRAWLKPAASILSG